jgi:hypothetical protein
MFNHRTALLSTILAVALVAMGGSAHGAVLVGGHPSVGVSDSYPESFVAETISVRIDLAPITDPHQTFAPILCFDGTANGSENRVPILRQPFDLGASGGMTPSSLSLSQVGGSGANGFAILKCLDTPHADTPIGSLLGVSRTPVPSAPVFRWFRPPRD